MHENSEDMGLNDRLKLIESMIAEGRRKTESWGWTFVLWGVAYYVAFFWGQLGHFPWAWPITMTTAALVTMAVSRRRGGGQPNTTMGRAIASLWTALGISMFILFCALGFTGRLVDAHIFVAAVAAFLGLTNAASSMILRWTAQFACAVLWWAASVAGCFGSETVALAVFLIAIFFGQIVFGIYGMVAESRRHGRGTANA
jgi:hypothetical protein